MLLRIEHIGSTAVPGLAAKPRIDIMPGVRSETDLVNVLRPMEGLGFRYLPGYEDQMPFRRLFSREADAGQIACNIHTVAVGSEFWERHLLFRDYLRGHPEAAAEYARLKRELAPRFTVTNDYATAKTGFISNIEQRVRSELSQA